MVGEKTRTQNQAPESKPAPRIGGLGAGAEDLSSAGGAPTIKWIELDFEELYSLGHIDVQACKLLERILQTYNVKYEIVVNISPDVGVEYFTNDIDFIRKFEKAEGWWHEEITAIREYAARRGARAVVELFDGYEVAYALVFGEE
jgi:hypothetical protein